MVSYSFVFLMLLLISILSFAFTTSVVPGWQTAIFPPWTVYVLIQVLWLAIVTLVYHIMGLKRRIFPRRFFLIHVMLSLFMFVAPGSWIFDKYSAAKIALVGPPLLFTIGQIVFLVGALKAKKNVWDPAQNE